MLELTQALVVLQRLFDSGIIDVAQLPWFFFHFENGLTRRLFGSMMCDHFFSFNLFQVFQMAKPLCCSLSLCYVVSFSCFSKFPPCGFWCGSRSLRRCLSSRLRIIKLVASIHASHSPSCPALTTPPPPLCTGRKQNNRMTHRWGELPVRWPCGETEWI